MTKNKYFSESTLLYAENAPVVKAIEEQYKKDVKAFLDAIRQRIADTISPLQIQEKVTSNIYRYWWIAKNEQNRESYPQLYFNFTEVQIVNPGIITCFGYAPNVEPSLKTKLSDICNAKDFSEYCTPSKQAWAFLEASINYETADNKVNEAAKLFTKLLLEIEKIYAGKINNK